VEPVDPLAVVGLAAGAALVVVWAATNRGHVRRHRDRPDEWSGGRPDLWTSAARCREGGANLGMFTATAFARKQPYDFCNWLCVVTASEVELSQKDFLERRRFHFPREQFEVDGALPAPAV